METSHNLDECLKQLEAEADGNEQVVLDILQTGANEVGRALIFQLTPVKTGLTAAGWAIGINEIPTLKVYRTKQRIQQGKIDKSMGLRQKRMKEIATAFQSIKRIADIKTIFFCNNGKLIELIENGMSKKAPAGILGAAIQRAEIAFEKTRVGKIKGGMVRG